jgi:hypothetical protein
MLGLGFFVPDAGLLGKAFPSSRIPIRPKRSRSKTIDRAKRLGGPDMHHHRHSMPLPLVANPNVCVRARHIRAGRSPAKTSEVRYVPRTSVTASASNIQLVIRVLPSSSSTFECLAEAEYETTTRQMQCMVDLSTEFSLILLTRDSCLNCF